MKTPFHPQSAKGVTLLEMTVVILVLLMLISVLFLGARAWKRGSDRAQNIVNIRNAQQAARSHQNLLNLAFGDDLDETTIYGTAVPGSVAYLAKPAPPNHEILSYQGSGIVPEIGDLWLEVDYQNATANSDYGIDSLDTSAW